MLLWHLPSVQPDSHQMSHLHAREPLAVLSGYIRGSLTGMDAAGAGQGGIRRTWSAEKEGVCLPRRVHRSPVAPQPFPDGVSALTWLDLLFPEGRGADPSFQEPKRRGAGSPGQHRAASLRAT